MSKRAANNVSRSISPRRQLRKVLRREARAGRLGVDEFKREMIRLRREELKDGNLQR